MKKIMVLSDIDGTLLNNDHQMTSKTREAIKKVIHQDIPFVLISARSPSGIYPILGHNDFNCPIVSYSGSLIMDENRQIINSKGFSQQLAKEIITFIEAQKFDLTWNIYSVDRWLVTDKNDPRVIREETIVEAQSEQGNIDSLEKNAIVHKILCMCNPDKILEIEEQLKKNFKEVNITKSSNILIEINGLNISKAQAIETLCDYYQVNIEDCIAFGDNYNDEEMLKAVGHPFLMDNAPAGLKDIIKEHTSSNEEDGIYFGLKKLSII